MQWPSGKNKVARRPRFYSYHSAVLATGGLRTGGEQERDHATPPKMNYCRSFFLCMPTNH